MKVNVKYFGMIAEDAGTSGERVEVGEATLLSLNDYLMQKYPALREKNFKYSVNKALISDIENTSLQEESEVALLPPFSGG